MPEIKNLKYLSFLDGETGTMSKATFVSLIDSIQYKYRNQARGYLILLYKTGARPAEILSLKAQNIAQEKDYETGIEYLILRDIPTLKRGKKAKPKDLKRNIWLKRDELTDEVFRLCLEPNSYVFWGFRNITRNQVIIKHRDGTKNIKVYDRLGLMMWYLITKWTGVPPYFFRHNCFTKMFENGASIAQVVKAKGAGNERSVMCYLTKTPLAGKKIAEFLD